MNEIERLRQATPVEFVKAACEAAPVLLARVAELEAELTAPVLVAEVECLSATLAELQARFDELHSAAREVAEVARLRDELNPPDDGRLWVSRWQSALSDLQEAVDNG